MRQLILLLFVITSWASAHAQEMADVDSIMDEMAVTDTVQPAIDYNAEALPADWYKSTPEWKQYKKDVITGGVLLGIGGLGVLGYGGFRLTYAMYAESPYHFETAELFIIVPTVVCLGIGSAVMYDAFKHKKLAKQLSVSPAAVSTRMPGRTWSYAPGLSLRFTF